MKKLISILVVFALLTAVAFAQDEGSWSVGGSGRIGTRMDFIPMEDNEGGHGIVWADGWDQNRDENVLGKLNVIYRKGGLSTGFEIDQQFGFQGTLSYNGENWQFGAQQNLGELIGTDSEAVGGTNGSHWRNQLWGNFTFQALNGIKVEAAVSRRGQQWWNVTDYFGDTFTHTDWGRGGINAGAPGFALDGKLGTQSYLMTDISPMAGLNIGFVIPNLFVYNPDADNAGTVDLLTQALQYTVFGAKYADGPLQIGFQFALKGRQDPFVDKDGKITNKEDDLRSGLYLGGTYQVTPELRAGVEFRGLFGAQTIVNKDGDGTTNAVDPDAQFKDAIQLGIGAQVDYNDGPFGVNLRIRFRENNTALTHNETFYVRLRPYYNIVDGYLRAEFGAELTFLEVVDPEATAKATDGKRVWASVMTYAFTPALYFNFLGTGAGSWGTGFAVRYRAEGPRGQFEPTKGHNTNNFLELVFNWSF